MCVTVQKKMLQSLVLCANDLWEILNWNMNNEKNAYQGVEQLHKKYQTIENRVFCIWIK